MPESVKLTYEQLEREALKLRVELDKTVAYLEEMEGCTGYELISDKSQTKWRNILHSNQKVLSETPIKL